MDLAGEEADGLGPRYLGPEEAFGVHLDELGDAVIARLQEARR
jgi:hypothetical protein